MQQLQQELDSIYSSISEIDPHYFSSNRIYRLTNELCIFLNQPLGTYMTCKNVTNFINNYIRHYHLNDSNNKQQINPDARLQNLLNLPEGMILTYFNLMYYINKHLIDPYGNQ